MTGAEHFAEAERLIDAGRRVIKDADEMRASNPSRDALLEWDSGHAAARTLLEIANVHATLALAAATERATNFAHQVDPIGYGRG